MFKLYKKDIKVIFSDKKALIIFILMPIILTTILSMALRNSFSQDSTTELVKVAIVKQYNAVEEMNRLEMTLNQYGIDLSNEGVLETLDAEKMFFESFLGDATIQKIFKIDLMTEEGALKALETKKVGVVLYLPEGFLYNQYVNFLLPARNDIDIVIKQHPEFNYSGKIATNVFESYFNRLNKLWVNKNVYLELASGKIPQAQLYATMNEIYQLTEAEEGQVTDVLKQKTTSRRFITSASYYAVGMMAMFILYASSHTGREMLKERHLKTLDRNYVAGVGYGKALLSKAMMTVTLCTVQMSTLMVYSKFVLGVEWERFDQLFVSILFSALAVSGLGVLISAVTLVNDDYKIANVFENIIVHLMALVGGSYIPVEVMPEFVGKLKGFALNGIVLDLFLDIYQGTTWQNLYMPYLKLIGVGVVFIVIGWIIIRRKEKSDYVGDAQA